MFTALRLRFWTITQLDMKDAELNARIDALVYKQQQLEAELGQTRDKISLIVLAERQQGYLDEPDEVDLMNLRLKETELAEEIRGIQLKIEKFEAELAPYEHEKARRGPRKLPKHLVKQGRELDKLQNRILPNCRRRSRRYQRKYGKSW